MNRSRAVAVLAACLALTSPPAQAEDSAMQSLKRGIELPAHRALMRVIEDPATRITEFETDGCSGGLSSTWEVVADIFPGFETAQGNAPPWEACCVVHDLAYHNAGGASDAETSFAARLRADEALRQCVIEEGASRAAGVAVEHDVTEAQVDLAYQTIAEAMFNAVRFGGGPCTGLPWRWGYGYPSCFLSMF